MELFKEYNGCKLILKSNQNELNRYNYGDLELVINNKGKIRSWKIKHDFDYWIKVQKTQIKMQNVLEFWNNIGSGIDYLHISNTYINKLIKEV